MRRAAGNAWLVLLLAAAACSAAGNNGNRVDAPPGGDAANQCQLSISFNPAQPTSNTSIRAAVNLVGAVGVPTFKWTVTLSGNPIPTSPAAPDGSQIDFFADSAGTYFVSVDPQLTGCVSTMTSVIVEPPGGTLGTYVEAVVPPAAIAPPQSFEFQLAGSANVVRPIVLDPGLAVTGTITNAVGSGVPAYVRFTPVSTSYAPIETFTGSDGSFSLRMLGQMYTALIVPATPGLPPAVVTWIPGTTTTAALPAGASVTGTVLDPTGAPLVGAMVQLVDAQTGAPSTLATTTSAGAFTVLMQPPAAGVIVSVTPPPGHGLPALAAMTAFGAMHVQYESTLATCNLSDIAVQRGGVNQANVGVTFVGSIASAGTITVGGVGSTATGSVLISAATGAGGTLPSLPVPKAQLSAVVAIAPATNDYAVATVDDSVTCSVAAINAPALQATTATITDPNATGLSGVLAQFVPQGPLAAAGALEVDATTGTAGALSASLASGGTYTVVLSDPQARGASVTKTPVSAGAAVGTVALLQALQLSGTLNVTGFANPVPGASIQIFAGSGSGSSSGPRRPTAETATDITSHFLVAIPIPGAM